VRVRWVPRELNDRGKINRMGTSLQHLLRYADEGEEDTSMLNRIVTGDETWENHYQPEYKETSQFTSSFNENFKVTSTRSAGKVMLIVFWESRGVLLAHFQKRGENVNSESYCEVLLKLRGAIRRKRPGQLAMPDPIELEQSRREFKNYRGNFFNIRLTVRSWPLNTSICLVR
jgi:hypothetical protein